MTNKADMDSTNLGIAKAVYSDPHILKQDHPSALRQVMNSAAPVIGAEFTGRQRALRHTPYRNGRKVAMETGLAMEMGIAMETGVAKETGVAPKYKPGPRCSKIRRLEIRGKQESDSKGTLVTSTPGGCGSASLVSAPNTYPRRHKKDMKVKDDKSAPAKGRKISKKVPPKARNTSVPVCGNSHRWRNLSSSDSDSDSDFVTRSSFSVNRKLRSRALSTDSDTDTEQESCNQPRVGVKTRQSERQVNVEVNSGRAATSVDDVSPRKQRWPRRQRRKTPSPFMMSGGKQRRLVARNQCVSECRARVADTQDVSTDREGCGELGYKVGTLHM